MEKRQSGISHRPRFRPWRFPDQVRARTRIARRSGSRTPNTQIPAMHHLILVREVDQQMSGSGCCGRMEGDLVLWSDDGCVFPERRERMSRVGEIYRAVREAFGDRVRITMIDPRNLVSFLPLVLHDAIRYRVPALTALRALTSTSLSTGIFDGQVLYRGRIPLPQEVVARIEGRLEVDRVGAGSTNPLAPR